MTRSMSRVACLGLLLCAAAPFQVRAVRSTGREAAASHANPIRRVVTMLQAMMKKTEAEGVRERELYEKFLCYCKAGKGDLEKAVAESNEQIPASQSEIEALIARIAQLEAGIAKAEKDREAAKSAIGEATSIREKEHKEYLNGKEQDEAQMAMIRKVEAAILALEKGAYGKMAMGFLQQRVGAATMTGVRTLLLSGTLSLSDYDREALSSFLSQGSHEGLGDGYVPASGEVIGMLKQMLDTMNGNLIEATDCEDTDIKVFKTLIAAKMKEIGALTKLIEGRRMLIGDLKVELVNLKESLSDNEAALVENTKFLGDIDKICAAKKAEYELRVTTRHQELVAISETIKILNDDDALDLFKKTLPSPSFMQMPVREDVLRKRALVLLQGARNSVWGPRRANLGFLSLALSGRKVSFAAVIKMIDDMVALLKEEQLDDENKKAYCEESIDKAEDKMKEIGRAISDVEIAIEDMSEAIATLAAEIEALGDGIVALDKSVAEATEQRKEENEDYTELMASDSAALQILDLAKDRLNKFYNSKLYKPHATTPAPNAEWAHLELGQQGAKPVVVEPPPQTWGAYSKKGEESNSVIAMIDQLKKELDVEMTEASTEENNAQEAYQQTMKDSAEKRMQDAKSLVAKREEKAALEADLVAASEEKGDKVKELMATERFLGTLRLDCDWLLKNFQLRVEARAGEVDSLLKAKAVLSGAGYSFLQRA